MDHIGNMLHYLQTGLEKQGYRGILSWEGLDRYKVSPPEGDDWSASREDGVATAVMWAKDMPFKVTVEALDC